MVVIKIIETDINTLLSNAYDIDILMSKTVESNNFRICLYRDYIRFYNFSDCKNAVLPETTFQHIVDKNFPGDMIYKNYMTLDEDTTRIVSDDTTVRVYIDAEISDDFYEKVEEIAYGNVN